MTGKTFDIEAQAAAYDGKEPDEILRFAYSLFDNIAISFSGAEDVVLIDMACKIVSRPQVFSLDTGRLHVETYRFLEQVKNRYQINFEILSPDPAPLEALVAKKGLYSFYLDGHKECCGVRKVAPLRRKLKEVDAWITGQRKDQSPTRTALLRNGGGRGVLFRRSPLVQIQPLGELELGAGVAVHPRQQRALQRVAPAGLCQHRLRTLHPSDPAQPARAGRSLVVGRGDQKRVRSAWREF